MWSGDKHLLSSLEGSASPGTVKGARCWLCPLLKCLYYVSTSTERYLCRVSSASLAISCPEKRSIKLER